MHESKLRAPRNRTLALSESELRRLGQRLHVIKRPASLPDCAGRSIHGDAFKSNSI